MTIWAYVGVSTADQRCAQSGSWISAGVQVDGKRAKLRCAPGANPEVSEPFVRDDRVQVDFDQRGKSHSSSQTDPLSAIPTPRRKPGDPRRSPGSNTIRRF